MIAPVAALLVGCAAAMSETPTEPSPPRALIAEARMLAASHGDAIWPGFTETPFELLLVEAAQETAFCATNLPDDFTPSGVDEATGCPTAVRDQQFSPSFLASFPAFGGRPLIIVGTPEATNHAPLSWVIVLIHEHFHQYQATRPDYFDATAALDLAQGDQTGMWMLNYPFPYDDPRVGAAFDAMATALIAALDASDERFEPAMQRYLAARSEARSLVSEADWRYAEFQLWNEGAARWTELAMARLAAEHDPAYAALAEGRYQQIKDEIAALALPDNQRVAFYPIGAAEAELLDRRTPSWRAAYRDGPLALGPYLEAAFRPR